MRIFVAGATGVVGRVLIPQLIAAGHQVSGISRSSAGMAGLRHQGATAFQGDVFDRDALKQIVVEAAPDVVMQQLTDLSTADSEATDTVRRLGTRNLVEAAKNAGVQRIVAQSLAFGYAPGDAPADESAPLDRDAEEQRRGMVEGVEALEETAAELRDAVLLRYGVLYGPGTWYAPDGPAAAALAGDPAASFLGSVEANDSVVSFVHVRDAARAAVDALEWPSGPVNITDDEPAAAREWVPVYAASLGLPAPRPTSGKLDWARGATNTLARSRGWQPEFPSWRTGFAAQLS
ncbi:NAD(P)-dependent oxidoreductase [Streptomyces antimycoticus]|uniref:dTDP-glucose 4,6-dehydratase n=1 Tax=Streptomyces antimycoticus TaxID=68175 RepID=A0A4D4K060_9ACTN|nr:NAD(P)-dependent oxidoreductase [Streptomyces antimycoticus]GDY41472.1 dTDP-glucose 4,6-dehydratase [Streptomyces antimycoticus]